MRTRGLVTVGVCFALLSGPTTTGQATADAPGSSDHPLVTRYTGSVIDGYEVKDFDSYTLPLGPALADASGERIPSPGVVAESSETFFAVSGDVTVTVDEAAATMTKIRNLIPAITIISTPASVQKLGSTYSVNLFFSADFDPKPGTYPIEFSYRNGVNTLGGSFRGGGTTFSHDTKGTAEFVEFGEQVRVRFEFETFDQSEGREGRRRVAVKGEAVCARADIFGG